MPGIVSILPAALGGFAVVVAPAPDGWGNERFESYSKALGNAVRLAAGLDYALIDGTGRASNDDCAVLVAADRAGLLIPALQARA